MFADALNIVYNEIAQEKDFGGCFLKKFFIFLACIFLTAQAGFCARYNVYTPQSYKQISIVQSPKNANIKGEAIELLVDYSGSMGPWIQMAIETLEFILPKIPKNSAVALRVFGDMPSGIAYTNNCQSTRLVAYFKKDNQANITKGLAEARLGGMTPLEFALRETVEKDLRNLKVSDAQNSAKKKKIILVTDGGETCGGNPCEYIRNLMKYRKDIQIDVVQLGYDGSLMCLTASTGGSYYKVQNKKQFENAFEQSFEVPLGTVESGRQQKTVPVNIQNQSGEKQKPGYKFINF